MTVQELTQRLAGAFGASCSAVALYGSSAVRPEGEAGDVNVLVIVRTLDPTALRQAATALAQWQKEGNRAPLILTEAEWRSSRDVFAMEHADIAARHRLLHGALPPLREPDVADLRHQLEYEAMGALIHLRQGILASSGDPLRALDLLRVATSTIFALLRGLLRVHGAPVPEDAAELVRSAANRAGFDGTPFLEMLEHSRGARSIPPARAHEVLDACHAACKLVVAHVDAMLHPDAPAID